MPSKDVSVEDPPSSSSANSGEDKKTPQPPPPPPSLVDEVRDQCRLLERTVLTKESRFAARVLRGLFALRRRLDATHLRRIVNGFYTHSAKERDELMQYIVEVR